MAECRHEIEELTCHFCTPRVAEPGPPGRFGPWFPARYDGRCAGECGEEIVAGDMIRADGDGHWLCDDCGRTPAELAPDMPGLW